MTKKEKIEKRNYRESTRTSMISEIISLPNNRFWHKALTPYQYRINDALDIYVTSKKYHNLLLNKRGVFTSLKDVVELQLGITV